MALSTSLSPDAALFRSALSVKRFRDLFNAESADAEGKEVTVRGWVRSVRAQKHFSFVSLNDGSTFGDLQIVADAAVLANGTSTALSTGSSVCVKGVVAKNPKARPGYEYEVVAKEVKLLGGADDTYPLQKKAHTLEFQREIMHLRFRTNTTGAVMRIRNTAAMAVHNYFQEQDLLHLHTPIMTPLDCEGAGELFQIECAASEAPPAAQTQPKDEKKPQHFFGAPMFLTVSGQLYAEMAACAMSGVYTFGPTFRAENSNTTRHLCEFWMIEPEVAFADLDRVMDLAEGCIKHVIKTTLQRHPEEIQFFEERFERGLKQRLEQTLNSNFARISYSEAIKILKAVTDRTFKYPVEWGVSLQTEHERYLAEVHCKSPVFVTDYPKDIKPFYMREAPTAGAEPAQGKTVRCMDLLVPGVGELIGGSEREDRFDVLKENMVKQGLSLSQYEWYLDLRKFGSVPHAGFGMGFERLLVFLTGLGNVRDAIPIPRTPGAVRF